MQEEKYYLEIENYIKKNETNKISRSLEEVYDNVFNFWNIGRLLIEVQGGEARAKYGDELIKKWSLEYTKKYGKGYDATNMRKFRQFYIEFQKCGPVALISWSHIVKLLPIKDINKRNYYINLCIENKLSKRELVKEIKSNSYERLINKPKHIDIIQPKINYSILGQTKNPIVLYTDKNIKSEHELEKTILANLKLFFRQLGEDFAFIDNQKKIVYDNKNYYIDILLFNIRLCCYVVVELKLRELKKEDKAQTEFYMNLIDKTLRLSNHNRTIGIIISKKQDKLIADFVGSEYLIPLEYRFENEI